MTEDPVITALVQQVDCYRRLAKLAQVQHEHIQQGRTEELLDVLVLRQGVLDELAVLDRTVGPVRGRWAQFLGGLDQSGRCSAESLLREMRELLEQITKADLNDTLVLQQRKLNLGRQITAAATARQVNRSYAAASCSRSRSTMDMQQ